MPLPSALPWPALAITFSSPVNRAQDGFHWRGNTWRIRRRTGKLPRTGYISIILPNLGNPSRWPCRRARARNSWQQWKNWLIDCSQAFPPLLKTRPTNATKPRSNGNSPIVTGKPSITSNTRPVNKMSPCFAKGKPFLSYPSWMAKLSAKRTSQPSQRRTRRLSIGKALGCRII